MQRSLNVGMDKHLDKNKIIGFSLGLDKEGRTVTGADFSGDIDTTQCSLSSYGSLELDKQSFVEMVIGIAKADHKVSDPITNAADQDSSGYFASIAYRGDLKTGTLNLSPYIRYDIGRIKMNSVQDVLENDAKTTDESIALGFELNNTINYKNGALNRFLNLEYKSDIRRENDDYVNQNSEQEVTLDLGIKYQKDDTSTSISYERIQSSNNKAHSDGIKGLIRWKF